MIFNKVMTRSIQVAALYAATIFLLLLGFQMKTYAFCLERRLTANDARLICTQSRPPCYVTVRSGPHIPSGNRVLVDATGFSLCQVRGSVCVQGFDTLEEMNFHLGELCTQVRLPPNACRNAEIVEQNATGRINSLRQNSCIFDTKDDPSAKKSKRREEEEKKKQDKEDGFEQPPAAKRLRAK